MNTTRLIAIAILALLMLAACDSKRPAAADDVSRMSPEEWDRYKFANNCTPIASGDAHVEAVKCADGRVLRWNRGM